MRLSVCFIFLFLAVTAHHVKSLRIERALLQVLEYLEGTETPVEYESHCGVRNVTRPETTFPAGKDDNIGTMKPKVQTSNGLFTGANLLEGNAFFNIPYAVPPVGDMRFKRPVAISGNMSAEFNVSIKEMVACYQHCTSDEGTVVSGFTEDCLTLNVYTPKHVNLSDPAAPPSDRLPVIVWLYGGGMMTGSANLDIYDGRFLSNSTNVIVVGVNYRLGIFGFMAFDEENGDEVKGNQGFKDQQIALQWVQDNIEKFGGDKNQVAIVGQSAGAQTVMFHLLSTQSKPLFQRAIVQSNPAMFKYQSLDEAKALVPYIMNYTKCTDIACLRAADPQDLVRASYSLLGYYLGQNDVPSIVEPMRVILDGEEFTTDPMEVFRNGDWNTEKQVIMGTAQNEIYVPTYIPFPLPKEIYNRLLNFTFGPDVGKQVSFKYDEYAEGIGPMKDYRIPLSMVITDSFFKCPVRAMARFASKTATDKNMYMYSFTHLSNSPTCNNSDVTFQCGIAAHSSENIFLFKSFESQRYEPTPEDLDVSEQLGFYWSNMAHSGNPTSNHAVGPFMEWPPYTEEANPAAAASRQGLIHQRKTSRLAESPWTNIILDSPTSPLETNFMQELCDFWDGTGYYVNMTPPVTPTSSGADVSTTTETGMTTTSTVGMETTTTTTGGGENVGVSLSVLLLSCILSVVAV